MFYSILGENYDIRRNGSLKGG